VDNTSDAFKVKLAIVHLEGKALQSHTTLAKILSKFLYTFLVCIQETIK